MKVKWRATTYDMRVVRGEADTASVMDAGNKVMLAIDKHPKRDDVMKEWQEIVIVVDRGIRFEPK